MTRILLADKLAPEVTSALKNLGADVSNRPDLTEADLVEAVTDYEIVVVRSTRVTNEAIRRGENLSLIIRAGAGVNTIDVDTASRCGVQVANCPGTNAAAVAELTIGLLIACDRQIVNACLDLREGRWRKKAYGNGYGLSGRTLGLLGFGAIGKAVAQAAMGLNMDVRVWSRSLTDPLAKAAGVQRATRPLDVADADVVSVHLALTPETKHIVNKEFLSAMRDGAILINTSRGPLVDTKALEEAIRDKGLVVGTDVFEDEPEAGEAPFEQTDLARQVTATPHIGASTAQTSEAVGAEVVRIVQRFIEQGQVDHAVNVCRRSPATHAMVVRHYNRVGVLAGVLDGLREEQINVQEMENKIFDGAEAASCTLSLDGRPSDKLLQQLSADEAVLKIAVRQL